MGNQLNSNQRELMVAKRRRIAGNTGLGLLVAATAAILIWVFVLGSPS
jgi:hypothetical protein